MAKPKSYNTSDGIQTKDPNHMVITAEQIRLMQKAVEREEEIRLNRGRSAVNQGTGPQGGTNKQQTRRKRKSSKKDLNRFRNQGTRGLDD